jgi:hypothetical protein
MATAYTSILKLALPVQGELSGTWGDVVNDNITSMVEEAIAGRAVINTWTTNSHTLTSADGTTSESRCAMLEFTDTGTALTGDATVVCPTAAKIYICKNDAGQKVTIKTSAGTGVAIADGQTMFVFCDGTNVVEAVTSMSSLKLGTAATSVQVTAVLDEDDLVSDSATALATQQSIKAYVDAQVTAQDLDFGGDSGTGSVDLDSQTFTIAGTANEIETSASGQTLTVGLPAAITVTTSVTTPLVQATNVNANDGSSAIAIADSTGQTTINDAVLTTADINAGTIDNTTIGATTASTGAFTTITSSGNTTVSGSLVTDTISEETATAGVTVDGVLLKDGEVTTDTINEKTTDAGVTVDGVLLKDGGATVTADINFGDNDKAIFGAGSDLQIYHAGSYSMIEDTGSGNLIFRTDGTSIFLQGGSETMAVFTKDGASDLYYDNAIKLATTATGIDVTGTVSADDAVYVDSTSGALLRSTAASGSNSELKLLEAGVGDVGANIQYDGTANELKFKVGNNLDRTRMSIGRDSGDVSFYESTGASAKMLWDVANEKLKFEDSVKAVFGSSSDLEVYHDGSNSYIKNNTGVLRIHGTEVQIKDEDNNETLAVFNPQGSVDLYYDNSKKFATDTSGFTVTGRINWASSNQVNTFGGGTVLQGSGSGWNLRAHTSDSTSTTQVFGVLKSGENEITTLVGEILSCLNNGNVGIGKVVPTNDLVVKANDTVGPTLELENSANSVYLNNNGSAGQGSGRQNCFEVNAGSQAIALGTTNVIKFQTGGVGDSYELARMTSSDMRLGSSSNIAALENTNTGMTFYDSGAINTARSSGQTNFYVAHTGTTAGNYMQFAKNGSAVGTIYGTTSGVSYNTTSDRRLKDNIETITDGTDKLMAMNPVTHTWKADPDAPPVHGFIAQEMQKVVPEAVAGEDGGEEMMSMDYGRITPVLVAALQDAHKKIEELETRLNELETK